MGRLVKLEKEPERKIGDLNAGTGKKGRLVRIDTEPQRRIGELGKSAAAPAAAEKPAPKPSLAGASRAVTDTGTGDAAAERGARRQRYERQLRDIQKQQHARQLGAKNTAGAAEIEEARQQTELRKRLATLDLIDKYGQRNHEDTYGGYIKSQYDIGQLGQDQAHAWSAVMRNPTAANLEYAQHVDSMIEDYTQRNQQALDPTGNHLFYSENAPEWLQKAGKWADETIGANVQYLPQAKEQFFASIVPAVLGLMAGGVTGGKLGYSLGTALYSASTMAGSAYQALRELGADHETAKQLATDEAFLSSLIEGADTFADLSLFGFGKAAGKLGANVGKSGLVQAAKQFGASGAGKALGFLGNIAQEGLEEGTQQAVSIANRERYLRGYDPAEENFFQRVGGLTGDAARIFWNGLKRDDPNHQEILESAKGGAQVAIGMGALGFGTGAVTNRVMGDITGLNDPRNALLYEGQIQGMTDPRAQLVQETEPAARPVTEPVTGNVTEPVTENAPPVRQPVQEQTAQPEQAQDGEAILTALAGDMAREEARQSRVMREQEAARREQEYLQAVQTQNRILEETEAQADAERYAMSAEVTRKSGGGLLQDEYTDTLDRRDMTVLDASARQLGVTVSFAGEINHGLAEGQITGRAITLQRDAESPLRQLYGHEISHRIRDLAPKEFDRFVQAVKAADPDFSGKVAEMLALGRRADEQYSEASAIEDVAADYAGRLMEQPQTLETFIAKNQHNPTLLQRLGQVFRELAQRLKGKLTGQQRTQAENAAAALEKAYAAAVKAERKSAENEGVRYALKRDFYTRFDAWDGKTREIRFSVGTTSEALRSIGVKDRQITWSSDSMIHSMKHEGMTKEILRQVPDILERPIMIMQSRTVSDRITVFGEAKDKNGAPVLAVVEINPKDKNGDIIDLNIINNSYGKDHGLQKFLENSTFLYLDPNKKRTSAWLQGLRLQLPSDPTMYGSISSIAYENGEVKVNGKKWNDIFAQETDFTKKETVFDAFDPEYVADLMREGNTLYTKNGKSLSELIDQGREVPKIENGNALSGTIVTEAGENVNPKYSLKRDAALEKDFASIRERLEAGKLTEEQADRLRGEAVDRLLARQAEEYGRMQPGEKPAREITLPRRTDGKTKVSRTVRTILEGKATPELALPGIKQLVAEGAFSYEALGDKTVVENANAQLESEGWGNTYARWSKDMDKGVYNKANTAMGFVLYNNAVNSGDTQAAMDILRNLVMSQRTAAQATQATRILKTLSPEAQLYAAQRSIDSLQREITQRYGDKAPQLKISEALAEDYMQAATQQAREAALDKIYQDIGSQLPSSIADRWNAWRYLSMLGNPRTHVRNILGNAFFAPVVFAKNRVGAAMEAAAYQISGGKTGRSKAIVGLGKGDRALYRAAFADFENMENVIMDGQKLSDAARMNKSIREGQVVFKHLKALEAFRKANGRLLDAEDAWFCKRYYANALASYAKKNGISAEMIVRNGDGLAAARAYAIREAQRGTYRDVNAFSQMVTGIGNAGRNSKNAFARAGNLLMQGVLPFKKTPANILARGVEYSPLGFLTSIAAYAKEVRRSGITVDERQAAGIKLMDGLSAGLTGTGLMALGFLMAGQGWLRGHGSDDDKERRQEEANGHQAYSLEAGGVSVTLDWVAPEALPVFAGANLYEIANSMKNGDWENGPQMKDYIKAITQLSDPMVEMSMLSGVADVIQSTAYAKNQDESVLAAILKSAATSYVTQALPTLFGQIERVSEDRRYTPFIDKTAFLSTDLQRTVSKASSKFPGLDYNQVPYIDAWGREEESGTLLKRAGHNFLNPAYTSKIKEGPLEKELMRVYKKTGDGGCFPSRAEASFKVNGENRYLNQREYLDYARKKGKWSREYVQALIDSRAYKRLSDEEKAEALADAYALANAQAKKAVAPDYQPGSWTKNALKAREDGISATLYLEARAAVKPVSEGLRDEDGETIANSESLLKLEQLYTSGTLDGLSNELREALLGYLGIGKKVRGYTSEQVRGALLKMRG
nr:MAG TPA: hypothetical protein [Caudoviricetes sp.]